MLTPQTIGAATIDGLAYIGGLARLGVYATRAAFKDMFSGRQLAYGRAVHQAMAVGIGALPILSLISFFIGELSRVQLLIARNPSTDIYACHAIRDREYFALVLR